MLRTIEEQVRHKIYMRSYNKRRYAEDPQRWISYHSAWNKQNPEYYHNGRRLSQVASNNRRLTRLESLGGSFTLEQWLALLEEYNYQCVRCGKNKKLQADHVIPVSKAQDFPGILIGDISNIQPLCKSCNLRKGTKFIDYRGRLNGM